jgi:hypothetical protein
MKKLLIGTVLLGAVMFTSCSKEETTEEPKQVPTEEFIASETPSNRTVLLENYTGVRCGFCPDGHVRAKTLADANPGKVIIMGIHAGSFAAPSPGWPNFTTSFGQSFVNNARITGYPAGTINRIEASVLGATPQSPGGLAMGRGGWQNAAQPVLAMPAPLNIGARAKYDAATKKLKIKVDVYYTSEQVAANNINVALVQDNIVGRQSGATNSTSYNHTGVLRHMITGQWGEVITEDRPAGKKITRNYEYEVPEHYNGASLADGGGGAVVIDDLKVIVFVGEGQGQILNAIEVKVSQ